MPNYQKNRLQQKQVEKLRRIQHEQEMEYKYNHWVKLNLKKDAGIKLTDDDINKWVRLNDLFRNQPLKWPSFGRNSKKLGSN